MTIVEKIESLQENETFVKEMAAVESAEELQSLFARYNLKFSIEEAQQILDEVKKVDDTELIEEDLENVIGGCSGLALAVVVILMVAIYIVTHRSQTRR